MKIAVIHPSLNLYGGAERVCIIMIKALQKAGHNVTLVTIDKTNWPLVEKKYGLTCKPDRELFLIPNTFETASLTSRVAMTLLSFFVEFFVIKLKEKHDLLINTSGESINLMEDIVYINAIPMRFAFDYPESLPITNSWWRSSSRVYNLFLRVVDKLNSNSLLLTNSKFNNAIIKKCFGRHALVAYPPVNVERFKQSFTNAKRKNLVITASRLRPGKNLEYILRVAKVIRGSKFLIVGPSDKASETTINRMNKSAEKLGVQDRIQVLINQPLPVLLRTLSEAKILLHTQSYEAFGMSIVEAMAAGCVPVVPRNGGPWFDILDQKQGEYGYSYRSVKEAAEIIEMLMKNEKLRKEVSSRASRRAEVFDVSVFERKILDVVNKVCLRKVRGSRCVHS